MTEFTTANENRYRLLPTILDLPVTCYDIIFEFLDVADLRSCRAVCTKWYTLTTKSYRKHTVHFIEGTRRNEKIMKENVEKFLKLKKYEDQQAPVLKLMLKDVDIAELNKILQQTPDSKVTMDNITHLQMSNVIFENVEILVEFVSQFSNLQHLSMDHSHPSTSKSDFNTSLKLNCFEGIVCQENVFPRKLNSLHLVIRDDCFNLLDLISVFALRIKTITELRLTVIPSKKPSLLQWTLSVIEHWHLFTFALVQVAVRNVQHFGNFLSKMIKKHAKTMKCLHINWGTKDCMLDNQDLLISLNEYKRWSIVHYLEICLMFEKADDWPDLALTDFALNLETVDEILSNLIAFKVIPFLNKQVNKGLRRIFLGRIQWSMEVEESQIIPNFFTYWCQEDRQVAKELLLTCSENVLLATKKSFADYMQSTIAVSSLFITDVVFKIKMRYPWMSQEDDGLPPVEKFSEWMPPYGIVYWPNHPPIIFSKLKSLQIYCEDKKINSFSIPTICMLCPALTVLKIVDGHGISVTKSKSFYQNYKKMSRSTISDCDLLFIFAKLKKLQSLTLWGNLSRLSDFGIIGDRLLEKEETIDSQHYLNFKAELTTVLQQEVRLDENSSEYSQAQLCIPSSANHLQDLNFLSLRGVGKYVSDAITTPNSRLYEMQKLATLEIVGDHTITVQGKKALNQFITTVEIEGGRRRKSFQLPVNPFW